MVNELDFTAEPTSAFATFAEATRYLEQACERTNVNHLSFTLIHSIDGTPDQVCWIATYDPAFMSAYMEKYTQLGDPRFEIAHSNNSFIDWVELLPLNSIWREIQTIATRYGITKYGISLPLKNGDNGDVLFSVNVKCEDHEWILLRKSLAEKFRPFAQYFLGRIRPLIKSRSIAEVKFTD